jgi:hypothetical protein
VNAATAPLDVDAFTREARTERRFCAATPAVCDRCVEVLEALDEELVCRSCGGRWPLDSLSPCPRAATAIVRGEDGAEDRLCASHAVVWRRLVTRARETLTASNPHRLENQ